MEWSFAIIFFYVGACFGSLCNIIIDCLILETTAIKVGVSCRNCNHFLGIKNAVPIFGFLLYRGKCKFCDNIIPIRKLLVEILCGLVFCLSFYKYDITEFAFVQLVFWGMLILVGVIDYETMYIYDSVLLFYFVIFVVYFVIRDFSNIWLHVIGCFLCFMIYMAIYLISKLYYGREVFGLGDVFFNAFLGFYLGYENAIFICCFPFYIAAFDLLFRKIFLGKFSMEMEISFAPYMCVSACLISLYSRELHQFVEFVLNC